MRPLTYYQPGVLSIRRLTYSLNSTSTKFLFGPDFTGRLDAASWGLVAACAAMLAWKFTAIWAINVNWDEFWFLAQVHELLRGDLEVAFQTSFTQAFRWLAWIGDEMAQIHAARICMVLLLALSSWQIARLASRWVSSGAALAGALAFLCMLPVQVHGGSFRADSLLLPILLGVLLLLTRRIASRRGDIVAGVLCGIGMAVSVKLALFAPLFAACVLLSGDAAVPMTSRLRDALLRCLLIGVVTVVVAAVLIGMHHATLRAHDIESASTFVDRSVGKTLLETSFLPRETYLRGLLHYDRFPWILMGVGFLLALVRRRWVPAAMALAVSPVLFYRNAYPYFYVDMLAPAAILIAVVVDEVRALARRDASVSARDWVPLACGLLLLAHGGSRVPRLSTDQQLGQREVLDAVHRIFPQPVPYLDEAGMVATFRKVNFFMSTWGIEEYQQRGVPFMASAMRKHRPPMLLANRRALTLSLPESNRLMSEDREAIQRFYQHYWGPIYIAGAHVGIEADQDQIVALPYPGKYRVESAQPVLVDGIARSPGDVFEAAVPSVRVARPKGVNAVILEVRLLTAEAGPPPADPPRSFYIFNPL